MKVRGRVTRKRVAPGSKSDRDAVVLVAKNGEWLLRRVGGNAFNDPTLDALVGKEISGTGTVHGTILLLNDWKELKAHQG